MSKKQVFETLPVLRLLNVATALDESPTPRRFTMGEYGRAPTKRATCGSPACAIGHYAYRQDLQNAFQLARCASDTDGEKTLGILRADLDPATYDGPYLSYHHDAVLEHFGITSVEAEDLFGQSGCDGAQTTKQAAAYIRQFVQRRFKLGKP